MSPDAASLQEKQQQFSLFCSIQFPSWSSESSSWWESSLNTIVTIIITRKKRGNLCHSGTALNSNNNSNRFDVTKKLWSSLPRIRIYCYSGEKGTTFCFPLFPWQWFERISWVLPQQHLMQHYCLKQQHLLASQWLSVNNHHWLYSWRGRERYCNFCIISFTALTVAKNERQAWHSWTNMMRRETRKGCRRSGRLKIKNKDRHHIITKNLVEDANDFDVRGQNESICKKEEKRVECYIG